mmetsp:Transcript_12587/g.22318  ORF Transcript_12587/g.22318 Transcript_12587/m.22318 type:complete len:218 (+) Transcript_12587:382-1035(+)|eukprot:CAMPEP_0205922804 /NCGR_PEP_ID=MMETSP1325-20131115/15073_1 /ASSEMBLY_ACC=CAM_ASM_000708 /TAXON_ID=236786 /ORGANISM="Florenciella sp., Strain RCC1007" /LENGTH=217 /DNA_ID=CAMNT_0053290879 /DNA_START=382 /DNA_END=1035 /DNA_ORIENTATION=-
MTTIMTIVIIIITLVPFLFRRRTAAAATTATAAATLTNHLNQPLHAVLEVLTRLRRAPLDVPRPRPRQLVEVEPVSDLLGLHGVHQVLLVREQKHRHVLQLLLLHQLAELDASLLNTPPVSTVNHVHQGIGLVVVVPPVRADGLLPSDVPHVQFELVLHQRLNVEALSRRDVLDVLITQLLEDGGLAGVVESEHEHAGLVVVLLEFAEKSEESHGFA